MSEELIEEAIERARLRANLTVGARPDRAWRDKRTSILATDPAGRAAGLGLWRGKETLFAPPGLDLIESPSDGRILRRQKHKITPDLGRPDTKTLAKAAHHVLHPLPIGSPCDRPSRWDIHSDDHNPASIWLPGPAPRRRADRRRRCGTVRRRLCALLGRVRAANGPQIKGRPPASASAPACRVPSRPARGSRPQAGVWAAHARPLA